MIFFNHTIIKVIKITGLKITDHIFLKKIFFFVFVVTGSSRAKPEIHY